MCGGVLHSVGIRRKPRGRPAGLGEEHDQRFSFCCAADGCRTRKTPPSFRFLGRKVYLGAVVVLVAGDAAGRDHREDATAVRSWSASAAGRCALAQVVARARSRRARSGAWPRPPSCRRSIRHGCRLRCSSGLWATATERLIALLRLLLPITGGNAVHAA